MELEIIAADRAKAAAYLADALAELYIGDTQPPALAGGRSAGLTRLRVFNVEAYAGTRNDVGPDSGASRLAPYFRHGCLSLSEARDEGVRRIGVGRATKWIQELAWRQFWQLQYARHGSKIFADMETPKVRLGSDDTVPDDIANAETGLACMDTSLRMLYDTGYMFNHARMWFAAYFVHHRKHTWQAGAKLFYRFLLCGDPASNSLSWQWVASTFSHKPYFFNRQNVEKYSRDRETGETYCSRCPAAINRTCPFDASYETLGTRLFGDDYEHDDHSRANSASRNDRGQRPGQADRSLGSRRPSPRG